jgi:hypothetical protein
MVLTKAGHGNNYLAAEVIELLYFYQAVVLESPPSTIPEPLYAVLKPFTQNEVFK